MGLDKFKKKLNKKADKESAKKPGKLGAKKKRPDPDEEEDEEEEEEEEEETPKKKGKLAGKKKRPDPDEDEEEEDEEEEDEEEEDEEEEDEEEKPRKGRAKLKDRKTFGKKDKGKGKKGSAADDYFDGFEEESSGYDKRYIKPGNYLLELDSIEQVETRNKGDLFIASFTVLESEGDDAWPEGAHIKWGIKLELDAAKRNIKQFVTALTGLADDEVDKKLMLDVILSDEEEHPLKGIQIKAEAWEQEKKKAKGEFFTQVRWENVEGQEYPWD